MWLHVFAKELGAEVQDDEQDDRRQRLEAEREQKWQALPRELKLAVRLEGSEVVSMPRLPPHATTKL